MSSQPMTNERKQKEKEVFDEHKKNIQSGMDPSLAFKRAVERAKKICQEEERLHPTTLTTAFLKQ